MEETQTRWLSYTEFLQKERDLPVRQYEIPLEHAISLPMPTKRWGVPGYAAFSSPALRRPGQLVEQGPPHRWWVVDARTGRLIIYALWKAIQYAQGVNWTTVRLPSVNCTMDEWRQRLSNIKELMDKLVSPFFVGTPGDANTRRELADALKVYLPDPILPQYQVLTPDFFAWLISNE